ncbi:MAG: hypothetical protein ACPHER_05995, partial [Nevskiales bacterium]
LHFEYSFWIGGERVFNKYAESVAGIDGIGIAERVYYAKALWCFLLITLQAAGVRFYTALTLAFSAYSLSLMLLFPVEIYSLLNLLLAVGMLIEIWVRRDALKPAS